MEQICRLAWATAATFHIPASPRGEEEEKKKKKIQKPHNRFELFKNSHPDKHLEDKSLKENKVNVT